jgi:recombinational DNA repair protein RecT
MGLIYKGEHYVIDGGELLEHRTDLAIPRNKQNVIGAYCFFRLKSGGEIGRVIDRATIDKARSYAAEKSTGWNNNWEEMALKTAALRAAKYVPAAPDMQRAIAELYAIDAEWEAAPHQHVQPERTKRRVLSAVPQPLQLPAASEPEPDSETITITTPAQDF